jgi:hypothetical protein
MAAIPSPASVVETIETAVPAISTTTAIFLLYRRRLTEVHRDLVALTTSETGPISSPSKRSSSTTNQDRTLLAPRRAPIIITQLQHSRFRACPARRKARTLPGCSDCYQSDSGFESRWGDASLHGVTMRTGS